VLKRRWTCYPIASEEQIETQAGQSRTVRRQELVEQIQMRTFPAGAAAIAVNPHYRLRRREQRLGLLAFALGLLFAMSGPLVAHEFKVGEIEIIHPWSRATPEGAKVAAGYLVIRNEGASPDRLVAVTGEIAGKSEVHEMSVGSDGVMTMRQLGDGLEIPAGGEVALKPGSFHVMFLDLKQRVREGEQFKGTLTFENAGTVEVEFDVQGMGSGAGHDGHGG
jgi:copper(I)-binding protein